MTKQYITEVPDLPPLPSPVSNAVVVGDTCHISGQLSVDAQGYRAGSAEQEAELAFHRIFAIAQAAGFAPDDIVYVDIAFVDIDRDIDAVNAVWGRLFERSPARTVYQAAKLPYGGKVKVQAIAMRE